MPLSHRSFPAPFSAIDRGSIRAYVPLLAAFAFFSVFIVVSAFFVVRSRSSAVSSPAPPSGFPSPASGTRQSSNQPTPPTIAPAFPSNQSASPGVATPATPASPFAPSLPGLRSRQLDAASARRVVESWLNYKKVLFSPPFDVSSLGNYVVIPGPLHSDLTSPGGSIDWLRSNRASYSYGELSIIRVGAFRQFPDRAHLSVEILEDLQLRTPNGIDASKSGRKSQAWVYELKAHNGRWLVYDYRKELS